MNLIRKTSDTWDPLDILTDLQTDLNRVFNGPFSRREDWTGAFNPDIEVHEEEDRYVVHADLPGMKKEDFQILVQGGHLTLKGARKEEREKKEKGRFFSERLYGSFSRTMDFPAEIDASKVKAVYKDGVLQIELPKAENARPKQIQVEVK